MTEKSKLLRVLQLQRIAEIARKINPNPRPTHTTSTTPTVLRSLPEHKPLFPLLLSHSVPSRLARVCADKYDTHANELRSKTETKLAPYLKVGGGQSVGIYSAFLENYSQALQDWAQSVLDAALRSLKRESMKLRDWEATYPTPLWLPSPAHTPSEFTDKISQESCILSSTCAPSHAFPTTYPPPLRPQSGLHPVEWLRAPTASPGSASTSAIDLDSLCLRFKTTLVIDENPTLPSQAKPSIFSLPTASEGEKVGRSGAKLLKKLSKTRPLSKSTPSAPSLKVTAHHKLSAPTSLSSPFPRARPTLRRASTLTRVSVSKRASASLQSPSPVTGATLKTPLSLDIPTADVSYVHPFTALSASPQSSLDLTSGQTNHPSQCLPYPYPSPTTPPALSTNLFYEPTIAASTPHHLSPGFYPMPIPDLFAQFGLKDCQSLNIPLISPLSYLGSTSGLVTGCSFSRSSAHPSPGFDDLPYAFPSPSSFILESNFFNTHAVF